MTVLTGLERLVRDEFAPLAGRRVGLLTNPSAVDRALRSAYRLFAQTQSVTLAALFGPEHGFAGSAADGAPVDHAVDPRTGCPIYSLYGETQRPTPAMLRGLDVLVVDIQDIGVRYYTFAWTVTHLLEAAGEHGVPVVILDRPNPWGGDSIAGPLLERSHASLVGRFPIPVQHGLTLGELATLVNALWNPTPAELQVIPCEGWRRAMRWPETGLPWVPPSPAMAHLSTLWHYPGACLVEGTTLSEGRGTALPFEITGAPWLDAEALADRLNADGWAASMGAGFRPLSFEPTDSKWAGQPCQGVQVHILDAARWRPLEVWLGVIITIRALDPQHFAWLPPVSEGAVYHFDRLIGGPWMRKEIEAGVESGLPVGAILGRFAAEWLDDAHAFELQRRPFLLYE